MHILRPICENIGETLNCSKSGIVFSKQVHPNTIAAIKQNYPVLEMDASFVHLSHPHPPTQRPNDSLQLCARQI